MNGTHKETETHRRRKRNTDRGSNGEGEGDGGENPEEMQEVLPQEADPAPRSALGKKNPHHLSSLPCSWESHSP